MLHEYRGLETARILIHSSTVSEGYSALWERKRLDLTVEAVVHDNPKWHPLFTRDELDRILPDNPVALQESYYQVFLNSRALQALGIEANAPDPQDFVKGSILRDAGRTPTGVIKGDIPATRAVAARLPKLAPGQLEASSAALVKDMNRAGLTSFGVPGCDQNVLDIFQRWKTEGKLNVRVFCIDGAAAGNPEQVDQSAEVEQHNSVLSLKQTWS